MNDVLKKYCLIMIDQEGEVYYLPRVVGEKNHTQAFLRLQEYVPGLLDGYVENINKSGGFELASYVAANGNIIIWPCDINLLSNTIIFTLPKPMENLSGESLQKLIPCLELSNYEVFVSSARFKNKRSPKVITDSLSSKGDYQDALNAIDQYIELSKKIDSLGSVTEKDIRNPKK